MPIKTLLGLESSEIEAITERCDNADIKYDTVPYTDPDEGDDDHEIGEVLRIHIPTGREERELILEDIDQVEKLSSIPFEKYKFLMGFYAIWSSELGVIESYLESGQRGSPPIQFRRLLRSQGYDVPRDLGEAERVYIESEAEQNAGIRISIGPASEEFGVLHELSTAQYGLPRDQSRWITIRIDGKYIKFHDIAVKTLLKVGDSLSFQLDMRGGFLLFLGRERRQPIPRLRLPLRESIELSFPATEYDPEPLSLYWYASSAIGMPLLQFLAYYQVIEYYFPRFSELEAQKVARNIIKAPNFDPHRDADITRLLSALKGRANSRSFGDERTQLRTTVAECVNSDELHDFLESDEERKEFFATSNTLNAKKLPIGNRDADPRNDVAERIYDIRCRIVHTKSGAPSGNVELLLPFSKEAQSLEPDIALIKFIAQRVVVASGTRLTM